MDKGFLGDKDIPESDRLEEAKNTNTYPVYFSGDADVALVYVELYLWTWLIAEVEGLRDGSYGFMTLEHHQKIIDSLTKELALADKDLKWTQSIFDKERECRRKFETENVEFHVSWSQLWDKSRELGQEVKTLTAKLADAEKESKAFLKIIRANQW